MTCENRFCVYWRKDNCTLNEVRLDGMGSCEDCIIVEVPEELLEKKGAKEKLAFVGDGVNPELLDLRREERCLVKFERHSPCFHITATGK